MEHFTGPCLVAAGPGSGKTYILTQRVKYLLEQKGVDPNKIMVITFTKAATLEMMERFEKLMGQDIPVAFKTFHSYFYQILKEEIGIKQDSLIFGYKRLEIIKEAAFCVDEAYDNAEVLESISNEISFLKNSGISATDYQDSFLKEKIIPIFENYEKIKTRYGLIDFDDMLTKTKELLNSNQKVLKRWQDRFDYYLVDEFQDINDLQFDILKMLTEKKNNIFVVGDDDQSIYGFRGANPKIMINFFEVYPGAKKIVLNINYRCDKDILNTALGLIENNELRLAKDIKPNKKDEGYIKIISTRDRAEESKFVVDEIRELFSMGESLSDIAIIYRNHSYNSEILYELSEAGIDFYMKDKMPNIYNHFIYKDILAYLSLASKGFDLEKMLLILNKPCRYLSNASIPKKDFSFKKWSEFYENKPWMQDKILEMEHHLKVISKMRPFAAINYLKKSVGYQEYLEKLWTKNHGNDKRENEYLKIFEKLHQQSKKYRTINDFLSGVEKLKYLIDESNKSIYERKEGVGLFTFHGSKGLEFKHVFIVGANEGVIPTKKTKNLESIEEERRLFYVGITRAIEDLRITYIERDKETKIYPSRFVSEISRGDL